MGGPFKPGRNGLVGVEQRVEVHSPLALVIIMLGTNDFQSMHPHNAWQSAQGLRAIVQAVRRAPIEPGMPAADILVVAPPPIQEPKGPIAPKFLGAPAKSVGLAAEYARVAEAEACHFFDAGTVTGSSVIDGVHLDADQHAILGRSLADLVSRLLGGLTPNQGCSSCS